MYLTRVIYCSELSGVNKDAISDILAASRRNNAKASISGMLLFNGNFFLQCLEGARSAVNETYHRIMHDSRHCHPVLLAYETIAQRDFGDWDMAYVPWTGDVRKIIRLFSISEEFNPYQLSSESATSLFRALRGHLPNSEYWSKPLQQA